MTPRTPADTLAQATAALLDDHDVTDLLFRIVRDAAEFTSARSSGLLVRAPGGELELLSATSHAAAELELFQDQVSEGPCLDVLASARPLSVVGADSIAERWPTVGPAIVEAGYRSVHAFPLVWHGRPLGGLNLFGDEARALDDEETVTARSFADMATLVIAQPERLDQGVVMRRLTDALEGRVVVERAKGVLFHQLGIDMEGAYDALVERSAREGTSLSATARDVVEAAQRPS